MYKRAGYVDIGFLLVIGVLLGISVISHFTIGYTLKVNLFLGIIGWLVAVFLKIRKHKSRGILVICLLTLWTFNIVSFTYSNIAFGKSGIYEYNGIYYSFPGINPLALLFQIVYSIVNYSISKQFFKSVFGRSDDEVEQEYKK
jgi:hypothetical protein